MSWVEKSLFIRIGQVFILFLLTALVIPITSMTTYADADPYGWKDIAVGGRVSLGIKNDGSVWVWGESNVSGVFGNGEKGQAAVNSKLPAQVKGLKEVASIAAGSDHALAVTKDGTVWTWGDNTDGQLGDGTETKRETGSGKAVSDRNSAIPIQVQGLSHVVSVGAVGDAATPLKMTEPSGLGERFIIKSLTAQWETTIHPCNCASIM
jgi:alpha-tubulin suppressor-like RCC1 family protein